MEMKWRKSSRSSSNGGACVELARALREVAARDSKNPNGEVLRFTPTAFAELLTDIKSGKYDQ
ncbi:protein of unknown function DUF397 [Thermomonospora curvata DSM 43183]|uniref:DUF397 domain-containing protein n=2 Tax=Thermomonosporaceae TaxID=2012 RepID=D1A9B6_THECD|nr:protein of unknown function DUF397 [Thermomonospora curvata DSM 43183]PKK15108.1 MAG: DUF397 domain-containing protein [Thermomonospora sp. CIF 1]